MKVIFLDIDGVLNCERTRLAFGKIGHSTMAHTEAYLDPVALGMLRAIGRESGALFVLSSSWRGTRDIGDLGRKLGLTIVDRTPNGDPRGTERGWEIQQWLDNHPECLHYAILDDSDDMLPHQLKQFIQTPGTSGFGWEHAERLCKMLGVDIYDAMHRRSRRERGDAPVASDAWRLAIDNALVVRELGVANPGDDPTERLKQLLDWEVSVAVDPQVSGAARDLIHRGRTEMLLSMMILMDELSAGWDRPPAQEAGIEERKRWIEQIVARQIRSDMLTFCKARGVELQQAAGS